ncbi:MAG TPA: D-2-hydroxyacid dehydrogenase [Gemmatimonadales bacterium]|nr:D-2-hydroxyacid dehydrogenase [Gemmatimonadales bacterium]
MTRRLVVDLAREGPAWKIPPSSIQAVRDALGPGWEVVEAEAGDPTAAHGAEVYFSYTLSRGVLEAARPTLRWVHSGMAGVAGSLALLAGTGIVLTNSAGIHADPIADWAIAGIAYFARSLDRMRDAQRQHRWTRPQFAALEIPVAELRDLRVGVFGLGGLGSAIARRALALGMSVAGVRRRPDRGGPPGVRWVGGMGDLARLAAESDCLVIAAPHTNETAGAVNGDILGRLPAGAMVVNVSRGSLLVEADLLAALDRGALRGAALDVFATEPLPPEHPFWDHPRVLVSPHAAAVTSRYWERETGLMLENIRRYLARQPLVNVVDQEAGY